MKELQHIEFFQLRPSTRVKRIANGLRKVFEKRQLEIQKFEQKVKTIKQLSEEIDNKL